MSRHTAPQHGPPAASQSLEPHMPASFWSDRPLGVKLAAVVALGAVALGVFAFITVQALQRTGDRVDHLLTANDAVGRALEADMMHDAVRGDVLAALVNSSGPEYQATVQELADHSAKFRSILEELHGGRLGAEVTGAVDTVSPDVESYLAAADAMITRAGREPAGARAAYPQFAKVFTQLEDSLP